MTDAMTVLLAVNSIGLLVLVFLVLRRRQVVDADKLRSEVALAVTDRLTIFEQNVRATMDSTKTQVATTGTQMQQNAAAFHQQMGALNTTIAHLVQQQQGAQELAKGLQTLLQAPKLRGNYGEEVLEEMLARILPDGIWRRQVAIDGRETVDAVIEFKGVLFPIDAKFPRDHYERYLEATDAEVKRKAWKAYETAMRTQIASISSKYVKPEKGTSEFALMFIPSEAIYYETIADRNGLDEENGIFRFAQENHVIPVSPNTFYAFLQVIVVAVKNVELLQNAKKLQEGLREVEYSFEKFFERFEDVGLNLVRAAQSYETGDGHIKRFKQRVDKILDLDFSDAVPGESKLATVKPESKPAKRGN